MPTTPPVPRSEAVRQLRSPQPLQPAQPPAAPVGRQSVTIPPPQPVAPAVPQLRPTTEAPKPVAVRPAAPVVPAYAASSSSLSAAEAAAAAAAAMSAARAVESAPAPAPVPAAAPAPAPAPVPHSPAVSAPAPAPLAAPAVVQRPARGVARAYAMDGATFYQGGRKIRVQGLDAREPGMTSEHATQRLQRALDGGSLSIEPVDTDSSGHVIAVVRVNGRNVAETVRAGTN